MTNDDAIPAALANPEAEAALLGAAMNENAAIDRTAEMISPEDFSLGLHGRIWAALLRERNAGRHAGPVALRGYFEADPEISTVGGVAYLMRLNSDPIGLVVPPVELAGQVRDLAIRRRMRAGLLSAADACAELDRPLAEVASAADAVVQAPTGARSAHLTLGDAASAFARAMDDPETGITCGLIPSLDNLLGPLRPGRLYVVAGRPGMGKTTVGLNYARGAAESGHGVQIFSLEMSARDVAGKMISDASFSGGEDVQVAHFLMEGRRLNDRQRRGMTLTMGHLATLPVEIHEGSITIGQIRSRVRSCKRRMAAKGQTLGLVIVDYLQLVNADRPGRSILDTVGEVSRGLKAIATDEGVAVMAMAQLSRAVEQRQDKRPILSDLRESGQIEQDADAILFLLREEYYHRHSEPHRASEGYAKWEEKLHRVAGVIEFILAKKRLGSTGTAFGKFHGVYQAVR